MNVKQMIISLFLAGVFAVIGIMAYGGVSSQAKKAMGSV